MAERFGDELDPGGGARGGSRRGVPDGITRADVLEALRDLERDIEHPFGASTGYDLLHEGRRFAPKAVVGLAARRVMGDMLGPYDFSGGSRSKCVRVLRQNGFTVVTKGDVDPFPDEIVDTAPFVEGAVRQVIVNRFERDAGARQACIAHHGTRCAVCAFDFAEVYGAIGEGFIHVHHLVPLSTLGTAYEVDAVRDLRPVCPNCHAMLHKSDPPFAIEDLQRMIDQDQTRNRMPIP
jgi:5-methylcytosine-specific restriction protein A